MLVKRDRLGRGILHIDLKMVLQVAADAGPVRAHLDAMLAQMLGRADPRQHQKLGRIDRTGRKDHLNTRAEHIDPAGIPDLDTDRAPILENDRCASPRRSRSSPVSSAGRR
jgi:hypothetical protein